MKSVKPDFFEKLHKLFREHGLEIEAIDPVFSIEEVDKFYIYGREMPMYICDSVFRITLRGKCRDRNMQEAAAKFQDYLNRGSG